MYLHFSPFLRDSLWHSSLWARETNTVRIWDIYMHGVYCIAIVCTKGAFCYALLWCCVVQPKGVGWGGGGGDGGVCVCVCVCV